MALCGNPRSWPLPVKPCVTSCVEIWVINNKYKTTQPLYNFNNYMYRISELCHSCLVLLSLNPYKGSWGRRFDEQSFSTSGDHGQGSGLWQHFSLSIRLCCPSTFFSVCLFSSLPELFLGEWSWIARLYLWHGHTISIFFSLLLSKGFRSCWHVW